MWVSRSADASRSATRSIALRLELLPPRERQQAANELASLLGRPLGHAEDPLLLLGKIDARAQSG